MCPPATGPTPDYAPLGEVGGRDFRMIGYSVVSAEDTTSRTSHLLP